MGGQSKDYSSGRRLVVGPASPPFNRFEAPKATLNILVEWTGNLGNMVTLCCTSFFFVRVCAYMHV
jgi:hypothetical protein